VWLHTRPSGDFAVSPADLANDAWLTAAEKIAEFDGTSSEFAGWLFGIARKHGANARRRGLRRRTEARAEIDDHRLVVAGPEPALAGHDWAIRALATLPARERDVVGCIDVVGLDIETTARALGISAVAVRVARHRGLRRLRERSDELDAVGIVGGYAV
jgi:RNA polymerase sigma-70 factor (ECF subfamily)